jgi:DNA-binding transcriptional ArsR family regulator
MSAATERIFRAVSDPTRRALLDALQSGERSVQQLAVAEPFGMSRPAISQHLRILLDAGVVQAARQGRQRLYCINREPIRAIYEWAARYIQDPSGHVWGLSSRLPRPGTN